MTSTIDKDNCSPKSDSDDDMLRHEFDSAAVHLRALIDKTDQETLLYLYARYKLVTEGACNVPKPGFFDFRAKQKWEAWKALGDYDRTMAMIEYVDKVRELDPEWQYDAGSKVKPGTFGIGVSRPIVPEQDVASSGVANWFDCAKDGRLTDMGNLLGTTDTINQTDQSGMTALHWAADRGQLEVVEWLIERGVDLNCKDQDGQTPLHYAYACDHQSIIHALVAAGADQSCYDNDGNLPANLGESPGTS